MTETARPKSTSRIFHECARQVGFNAADGWPSELTLWELALVLSGVANDVETWQSVIAATPPPTITRQLPRHEEEKRLNRAYRPEQHGYRLAFWEELVSVKLVEREAVAAWLRTIGETSETLPPCALAWLGDARGATQAPERASQPNWETLSPEQKKAAWDGMTKAGRQDKARELVKKHGSNAGAAAEVGITRERIGQIIKEGKPKEAEAPLPVNHWTQLAGLAKPKRGKASR